MKHNTKITIILILMFFITQLIGLFVIGVYSEGINLPYGMQPPEEIQDEFSVIHIIFSFIIAIVIFLLLTKLKAEIFIRMWFFLVVILALGLTLSAILSKCILLEKLISPGFQSLSIAAIGIAIPLAYYKIFKRNLIVHNLTELLIYPGVAAVFIPILNIPGIIILLLIISLYDIWAVWHSGFMQKMANYQINELRLFTGFFIPYANKTEKAKIKRIKQKFKNKSENQMEKEFKKQKIKVNLAILGGGDVIFPIITSGIFLVAYNSIVPALIISVCSTLALLGLFVLARKGKFYPAMPFITSGIYLGIILNWILLGFGII